MTKKIDSVKEFDFGFSFVDENYEDVKETQNKLQEENNNTKERVEDLQKRIELLHKSILPFLDNLCKNPEKSTIHWPKRVEKIKQFKERLNQIAEGNTDI
jgi:archaellum component FlaC